MTTMLELQRRLSSFGLPADIAASPAEFVALLQEHFENAPRDCGHGPKDPDHIRNAQELVDRLK